MAGGGGLAALQRASGASALRELADILGYSPIHINRAVRDLRDRGLLRWNGNEVEILDWAGLVRLSRFDPTYLDREKHRR